MDSNYKGACSLVASMTAAYIAASNLEPYYLAAGDTAGKMQENYSTIFEKIADMPDTAMQIANMGGSLEPFASGIAFAVASIIFAVYALQQTAKGQADRLLHPDYDNHQYTDKEELK